MESPLKWGIVERVTVAAFIAGVAGVVASVTLPQSLQEFLSRTWWGDICFGAALPSFCCLFYFLFVILPCMLL